MRDPDAPTPHRYLLAAALWLGVDWTLGLAILRSMGGDALFDWHIHAFVLLPSLLVVLLGMGLLWLAISKADIRSMHGLIAIGVLTGFFVMTAIAWAVAYAFREPDPWLLVLVPGCMFGGAAAGVSLAKAFPRTKEWWPAPPHP